MHAGKWNIGNLNGCSVNGVDDCNELRKRINNVCCLQEVRCRGQGYRMLRIVG